MIRAIINILVILSKYRALSKVDELFKKEIDLSDDDAKLCIGMSVIYEALHEPTKILKKELRAYEKIIDKNKV